MAKNKKHINDKFYTKKDIVIDLIKNIDLTFYDVIIEPSAGNGSFSDLIPNIVAMDIEPENSNIIKQDWFTYERKDKKKCLVIGNPPFGNQGSLAMKFIKKAIELNVDTIAFILPKSFKKDSVKSKIDPYYHISLEKDLSDNSFLLEGVSYDVPCVFQIWNKKDFKREIEELPLTIDLFDFVKKCENPDISFRRVGFYAGKVYDDVDKSEQSHYFIKSKIDIEELKSILNKIEWSHNNTAGPRSIGKRELIKKILEII